MIKDITTLRQRKYLVCLLTILATADLCPQPVGQLFTEVISAPVVTIKSGSIIRLDIAIKSNSNELMILRDNRLGPHEAGILVWDSYGDQLSPREEFKPGTPAIHSGIGMAITPGKSITESVDLNRWFDLTKPGQYAVQAIRRIPKSNSVVKSNKVTITVTP